MSRRNDGAISHLLQVDVFSFGIVLWEILTGEEPYANMHYGAIIGLHILLLSDTPIEVQITFPLLLTVS